ncbi:MAG: thioredoxin [Christensenellales bacterium]
MKENLIELTDENFDEVISQEKVSLIDFWANWCPPCKMLLPIIDELAEEKGQEYNICKVNVDENGDIAERYSIMTIPTLMVFKKGEMLERLVGVKPKNQLLAILEKHA